MPKTATRVADTKQDKKPVKAKPIKQVECDLGDAGKAILDKMGEFRQARLAAEREEKILKEQLKELLPTLKKNSRMTVRAAGVIRGTVSWRKRKNTDFDLLLQAWPEAFEAVVSDNEYTQFDPA
jgi:hypothetical protein